MESSTLRGRHPDVPPSPAVARRRPKDSPPRRSAGVAIGLYPD